MAEPTIWQLYRTAWRRRPWLAVLAALAVLILAVSIVATVTRGPLAVLFIPGLLAAYAHHLLVTRHARGDSR